VILPYYFDALTSERVSRSYGYAGKSKEIVSNVDVADQIIIGRSEGSCAHTEVLYTETATTAASIIETTKPRFTV
jgi:hypothetical protein